MKRLAVMIAVLVAVLVASASAGTILYDPPPESGTVSYDAPPVDVPYTVDPPESCTNPEPASGTVGGVDVTLDQPAVCVDPPPISGDATYNAPPVDVQYTHDPAPRNVTYPDQVAADCADGLDNDADGQIDMADGGCATADDTLEAPNPACSDGIDNDGDGLTDYPADPGCRDIRDTGEFNSPPPPPPPPAAQCADGIDNDADGLVDLADPGCTDAADNDETDAAPPPPPPPPPSGDTVTQTNQRWTCSGPVNLALVKVTVDSTHMVTPAVQIASGCSGTIARIEIDNANGDGIHVGAGAHDLTVGGGYVRSPAGGCTLCGALHVDGIQVLGGSDITFNGLDVNFQTASNSALYINEGSGRQERPTDIVCDGCTFKRSPTRNRVVRIGESLRSGVRNSTVYWCGTGPTCDAPSAEAIWGNGLAESPVGVTYTGTPPNTQFTGPTPDNTLILNGS